MKCPKYIEEALRKRVEFAIKFQRYDWIVSNWCDIHDINLETWDSHGGCESLVNPYDSEKRILRAIREKE